MLKPLNHGVIIRLFVFTYRVGLLASTGAAAQRAPISLFPVRMTRLSRCGISGKDKSLKYFLFSDKKNAQFLRNFRFDLF
jgi:hypothetical protein